jgi:hypothetical protein
VSAGDPRFALETTATLAGFDWGPSVSGFWRGQRFIILPSLAKVIGEIRKGIERIRPKNNAQANAIEDWLLAVDKAFGERILPVDRAVTNGSTLGARCRLSMAFWRRPLKTIA